MTRLRAILSMRDGVEGSTCIAMFWKHPVDCAVDSGLERGGVDVGSPSGKLVWLTQQRWQECGQEKHCGGGGKCKTPAILSK